MFTFLDDDVISRIHQAAAQSIVYTFPLTRSSRDECKLKLKHLNAHLTLFVVRRYFFSSLPLWKKRLVAVVENAANTQLSNKNTIFIEYL